MPSTKKRKFKRLFLAADLHGSEIVFRKFLAAAKFYEADACRMGGDVTAKTIVPVVEGRDGRFSTRLAGQLREHLSAAEIKPIEKAIEDSGQYPVRLSDEEYNEIRADPDKVDKLFIDCMIKQLRRWTEMAENHLAPLGIPMFWIGGNDDKPEALATVTSTPHVQYIDESVARFDEDHEILGFGWTNPSPWRPPRELPEEALGKRLGPLLIRDQDPSPCISLIHAPTYETRLGLAPRVNISAD